MDKIYDLIIIGSGPAGLAAGIYAARARLDSIVIEKEYVSGGQIVNTCEVDNYPGLPGIGGLDMGMKFREHADHLGVNFVTDRVERLECQLAEYAETEAVSGGEADAISCGKGETRSCENGETFSYEKGEALPCEKGCLSPVAAGRPIYRVVCENGTYKTRTVIIAAGAVHRKLGVPGEEALAGMGVSYCATCDGAFFRNKDVAVVGGGDVALEDAIFLARICRKVYLIHRRDELRGAKSLQEKVKSLKNVEILWDTVVTEIKGADHVSAVALQDKKTGRSWDLELHGVFIAVGITPNSRIFEGLVETDGGYIAAGEDGKTSAPGIFAAGDIRTKDLRQIVTAVADGANAVASAEKYLA